MNRVLKPSERLVVAFDPPLEVCQSGVGVIREWVDDFGDRIQGTGVIAKVGAILAGCGYDLVCELREKGFPVFVDEKWFDTRKALEIKSTLLSRYAPSMLTLSCELEKPTIACIRRLLPRTELLGVTLLTTASPHEVQRKRHSTVRDVVVRLACDAYDMGLDGVTCAPAEIVPIRHALPYKARMSIVTPGVCSRQEEGNEHDPFRTMSVGEAILNGATRVVVGRPITGAENPREVIEMYIREIEVASTKL